MILLIGVELLKTSVDKIIHPVAIAYTFPLYVVLVVSVLVKFWMYLFNRKLGKMIASSALFATAIDSRNDAITTVAILLSAIVAALTDLNIDGYVSLGLSAFIMYSGVQLARQTISPLLGESASPRLREDILSVLEGEPKVLGYHDLMIHDYGPGQRFGSLHIEMDCREDPMACHDIIDNMERICLERYNIHLVIHYDPIVTDDGELSRLRETVTQILRTLDSRISIHDFRMVRGNDHTNLIFDVVIPYEFALTDAEYEDFVAFASKKEFDSRSAAQAQLDQMLKAAKNEDLYEPYKEAFDALEKSLKISKEEMLRIKKAEFKPLLEEEIVYKYYYTPGRVESIIRNDVQLHKTLDLIK